MSTTLQPGTYVIHKTRCPSANQPWIHPVWVGVIVAPTTGVEEWNGRNSEAEFCANNGRSHICYFDLEGNPKFNQHDDTDKLIATKRTRSFNLASAADALEVFGPGRAYECVYAMAGSQLQDKHEYWQRELISMWEAHPPRFGTVDNARFLGYDDREWEPITRCDIWYDTTKPTPWIVVTGERGKRMEGWPTTYDWPLGSNIRRVNTYRRLMGMEK